MSDRTGWWNLYRLDVGGGAPEPLCPRDEEFGFPMWLLGYTSYAVLDDGRIAVLHGTGTYALGVLDPATGELTDLDAAVHRVASAAVRRRDRGRRVGGESRPRRLRWCGSTLAGGTCSGCGRRWPTRRTRRTCREPRSEALPGPGGRDVHAHVYPPRNADAAPPGGELPPYVVFVHGGPTAQSPAVLDLEIAYFTSRGIGVVDVNYGGSTGYGRAYRERLR